MDEVLETASVDGAASFFLTVYIISSSVCPSDQFWLISFWYIIYIITFKITFSIASFCGKGS